MFLTTACICTCFRVWSSTVDFNMSVMVWIDVGLYFFTTQCPENWDCLSLHVALNVFLKAPLEKDSSISSSLEKLSIHLLFSTLKIWSCKEVVFSGFTYPRAFKRWATDSDFGKTVVLVVTFPCLGRDGEIESDFVARSEGCLSLLAEWRCGRHSH